ncbi:hypothetical protein CRUP_019341, partial [Coryphaenoides rupestris]
MEAFARSLRNAVCLIEEGLLPGMVKVRVAWQTCSLQQERYASFGGGIGLKVEEGSATLEDME